MTAPRQTERLLTAAADAIDVELGELPNNDACELVRDELEELALRLRRASRHLRRLRANGGGQTTTASPSTERLMLTRKEVAERLSTTTRTVDRLAEDGKLQPLKRGRFVRFAVASVEEFATKHK